MANDDCVLRSDVLKAVRYENWREENRVPTIDDVHLTEYQLLAQAINRIPAADAIPVEWLKAQLTSGYHRLAAKTILEAWRYESQGKGVGQC